MLPPSRPTRRCLLATALPLAAAAAACAGCAASVARHPSTPTPHTRQITLSFEPLNAGLWSTQGSQIVLEALWKTLEPWRSKHPSVRLKMLPFGGNTDTAALLSGTAPDVLLAWQNFGSLAAHNLLLDLTPYLRAGNDNLSVWPSYAVNAYRIQGRQYAFPFYVATTCMVVDQALLDSLGLSYPAPDATFSAWTTLWSSTTRRGGHPRFGGSIKSTVNGLAQAYFKGWGGSIMDPTHPGHCTIDSPECVAAAKAIFPLISEGICGFNYGIGDCISGIESGTYATAVLWNAALAVSSLVEALAHMPKWDFYPMPTMPAGSFAHTQYDYRAINAATRHPEAAWELLQWLSFVPDFQRTLMRYGLEPPALKALQAEYTQVIAQVVPPFRYKNLAVLTQYVRDNGAIMEPIFPVLEPQAQQLIAHGEQAIIARTTGVTPGLQRIAQQVTAMQAAGLHAVAEQQRLRSVFPTRGPSVAPVVPGL